MSSSSDRYLEDDEMLDTMDEDSVGSGPDNYSDDDDDDDEVGLNDFDDDDDNLAHEDADDDDVEAGGFDVDLSADRARKKSYEVDFKVLDADDIVRAQKQEVAHVAGMFMLKDTDAAILLRHFSWNKERLIERYMDAPERVSLEAGVCDIDSPNAPRIQRLYADSGFVCDICFSEADGVEPSSSSSGRWKGKTKGAGTGGGKEPFGSEGQGLDTLALACGHRFCKDCYRYYVIQKVKEEGESRRVQCMAEGCNAILDERTVSLLVDEDTFCRYLRLLNRTYVDDSSFMRWCPAPNCEHAIECHVTSKSLNRVVPSVQCACGLRFCFGCAVTDHQPVVCKIVRKWVKKCEDDSETANWVHAHTKECPKCSSTIEKNGGCNHMTCRHCRHEWCWICSGPWSEHGTNWYKCNRFDEKSGAEARDSQAKSRASLERYLHYFNRWANHEQSARLERELYSRTEKKMEEMQLTSDLTWIEVQFLKKAVDMLGQCRSTLKWTYCMAFYLARDNMTELFEDNQRDLERAVEDLSEQLEKPIDPQTIPGLRQKVTDLTVYVQKRREIMLADTAQGFQEDRWRWNVSLD